MADRPVPRRVSDRAGLCADRGGDAASPGARVVAAVVGGARLLARMGVVAARGESRRLGRRGRRGRVGGHGRPLTP